MSDHSEEEYDYVADAIKYLDHLYITQVGQTFGMSEAEGRKILKILDAHEKAQAVQAEARKPESDKFATLSWFVDDVRTVGKFKDDEAAETWLANNQKYLRDALVEHGWTVLRSLLSMDGIPLRGEY